MRELKPSVVVGTGGYVSGPVVFAASLLGIPTLLQEQNSYPGVTTRLLASRASEVHITFDVTRRHLKRADNVNLSGNPTRAVLGSVGRAEAAAQFGLDPERRTLLILGGSLGASSMNAAVEVILDELRALDVQLLWQTGERDYQRLRAKAPVWKFIEHMEYAYAACDLAVCRAGATTLAELTRCGVPAILVPYPHAAADHQTTNARSMVEAEAAVLIRDGELQTKLLPVIRELLADAQQLRRMAAQARALGKPDAAATLAHAVMNLATG
jgi:UDP-N-acetylglucosamine--N-acetylmuramyl-(pentapeptide) pyrophosphoryl-undecaprenol N-acetylglucosamine transferase